MPPSQTRMRSAGPTSSTRKRPKRVSTLNLAVGVRPLLAQRSPPLPNCSPNPTWSSGCCRTAWDAATMKSIRIAPCPLPGSTTSNQTNSILPQDTISPVSPCLTPVWAAATSYAKPSICSSLCTGNSSIPSMPLKPLLEGIFSGLEQADILGSLIRPKEYLDNAIAELQRPHTIRMEFDPEEAELRRTITTMANHDPVGLRQMLLERIADSFKSEAGNTDDVSAALFGREAEQGVRLLQLLDHRYAVVVTNPPYMGSKNMDTSLKKYVEKYYPSGKRDLYATFILRCIELCRPGGRVAMVTMQGWIFLRSFVDLRAVPDEKLLEAKKGGFTGILRETSIEGLVHLGRYAFSEIGNAIVAPVLFTMQKTIPV